ncbi:hypothetical protein F3W81_06090 [Pseudooceanicola spongiae]|uniref:CCHC-type domain-containing protein n=1 Tax=Pseudooceanicola spongiae TaxID=2613965 RepID=A0A7L9WJL0_9RHOB|nr:hypothetical protein F3W81_06090 [Pseudooceanicola spongiae]
MRCSYCGSQLHGKAICPHTWGGSSRRANLRCTYCGGRDHDAAACPKRHTGPADRAQGLQIKDPWVR